MQSSIASRAAGRVRPARANHGQTTRTRTAALKDNFARLSAEFPPESMQKVVVRDASGAEVASIPNADGKRASLVFYAAAAAKHGGELTSAAADDLLSWYHEFTEAARAHRGSHPNIDLPLDVKSGAIKGGPLRIEVVKAQQ